MAALVALFASRTASAAILVPMCGEHAETVAAPPIVPAAHTTVLRASPCADASERLAATTPPEPVPERTAAADTVPRMPPVFHGVPAAPLAGRIARDAERSGERAGFPRAVERPPCG